MNQRTRDHRSLGGTFTKTIIHFIHYDDEQFPTIGFSKSGSLGEIGRAVFGGPEIWELDEDLKIFFLG
jgi:hypothetical protein